MQPIKQPLAGALGVSAVYESFLKIIPNADPAGNFHYPESLKPYKLPVISPTLGTDSLNLQESHYI